VTTDSPKSTDPADQLVAYLDGELDTAQTAAVEEQLRKDPALRQQVEKLDRTWSMLDALEPVGASEGFSQQTMATVVATSAQPDQAEPGLTSQLLAAAATRQTAVWFAVGILGTCIGLGIQLLRGPSDDYQRSARLLNDLEMLERYPLYISIPNVSALQKLADHERSTDSPEVTP
jgi:anti-sigma factor RsiW